MSRASPASVVHASRRARQAAGLQPGAHGQVVVAAEEGAEAELLGAQGDGEQVVVRGALLGLGEDAELVDRVHRRRTLSSDVAGLPSAADAATRSRRTLPARRSPRCATTSSPTP